MYNNTITVFNFAQGKWYPSVIEGADLLVHAQATQTTHGTINAGTVEIIVHCTKDKVVKTTEGGKLYLEPKVYAKDPSGHITFKPETDFIYSGAWENLSPINDDDYDSGFYNEANRLYDGVYQITGCGYYSLLPHFEIGAK